MKTKFLLASALISSTVLFSCGGGGSTVGENNYNGTNPNNYANLTGQIDTGSTGLSTLAVNPNNPIASVSAVHVSQNGLVAVTGKINNKQFSLTLPKNKAYVLLFFDKNGNPVGATIGKKIKVNGNATVKVSLKNNPNGKITANVSMNQNNAGSNTSTKPVDIINDNSVIDNDNNGIPDNVEVDKDNNGRPDWDNDGNGKPDFVEDKNNNGVPDFGEDKNNNGIPDMVEDRNGNGTPDYIEDKNGNGIPDGLEDNDQNRVPDYIEDKNGDGIADGIEGSEEGGVVNSPAQNGGNTGTAGNNQTNTGGTAQNNGNQSNTGNNQNTTNNNGTATNTNNTQNTGNTGTTNNTGNTTSQNNANNPQGGGNTPAGGTQPTTQTVSFSKDVYPILKNNCQGCHGATSGGGNLRIANTAATTYSNLMKKAPMAGGSFIDTANPSTSLLLQKATGSTYHGGGQIIKLNSTVYNTILNWIQQGAKNN